MCGHFGALTRRELGIHCGRSEMKGIRDWARICRGKEVIRQHDVMVDIRKVRESRVGQVLNFNRNEGKRIFLENGNGFIETWWWKTLPPPFILWPSWKIYFTRG